MSSLIGLGSRCRNHFQDGSFVHLSRSGLHVTARHPQSVTEALGVSFARTALASPPPPPAAPMLPSSGEESHNSPAVTLSTADEIRTKMLRSS